MVDVFLFYYLYIYETQKPLQQKKPYIFQIISKDKSTSSEAVLWVFQEPEYFKDEIRKVINKKKESI